MKILLLCALAIEALAVRKGKKSFNFIKGHMRLHKA